MIEVVDSQLNPLANAFIPTSNEFSASKKSIKRSMENETETTWERKWKRNSNDLKSKYKMTKGTTIELDYKCVLWKDMIFGMMTSSMFNVFLGNFSSTLRQTGLQKLKGSKLPMLPGCLKDDDQKLVQKSKAEETLPKILLEETKCNCPPMFGWVVPPDFIGNPFNFKYECSKKYPHCPNCTIKQESDVDTLDHLDSNISGWTLDQCVSEMKDILADVYETISDDSDPISKWDEKYKIQDYLEVSDSDSSDDEDKESNSFGTEFISTIETEPELVDDGVHPLLQSRPTASEDDNDSVEQIEKILGRSLSPPLPEYVDAVTSGVGAMCNPPCSVWCEFLPPSAKAAFRKRVEKSGNTEQKECSQRPATGYRPVFKRSLSADDAPIYDQISKDLNHASEMASREMLLLRRKDPLNYFREQSSNTLKKGKHGSCDLTDQHLLASSIKSNMWGKFDGADSLWQPLPECNAANIHNQKLNVKKGREIRRQ